MAEIITIKKYIQWIIRQPSCLDGQFGEILESGEYRNIDCHVRRANNSGTGIKPDFNIVPMTFKQHALQHQQGELAAIMAYTNYSAVLASYEGSMVTRAKAWFDGQDRKHLLRYKRYLKQSFTL